MKSFTVDPHMLNIIIQFACCIFLVPEIFSVHCMQTYVCLYFLVLICILFSLVVKLFIHFHFLFKKN